MRPWTRVDCLRFGGSSLGPTFNFGSAFLHCVVHEDQRIDLRLGEISLYISLQSVGIVGRITLLAFNFPIACGRGTILRPQHVPRRSSHASILPCTLGINSHGVWEGLGSSNLAQHQMARRWQAATLTCQ
jgi:hypothetical protein